MSEKTFYGGIGSRASFKTRPRKLKKLNAAIMVISAVLLLSSCANAGAQTAAQSDMPETLRVTDSKGKQLEDYQTEEITAEVFFDPKTAADTANKTKTAIRSSILIEDGKLFFGNENNEFSALNMADAAQLWSYTTAAPVETLPVYVDDKIIFNAANILYILNADDGTELFKIQAEPEGGSRVSAESYAYNDSRTCVSESIAYFAANSGNIYAVDINTGDIVLTYENSLTGYVASGVDYYDGKLYFVDAVGQLCCITKEGEEIFKTPLRDRIYAPMTFDGGKIYLGGRSCKLYCVDANSGAVLWSSYSVNGTTWFSGGSVIIGDMVYACTSDEHAMPSYNKNTGEFNRIYSTETNAYTKPVQNGDNIVLAASDVYNFNRACVMEFDTTNNRKLWRSELKDSVLSSPAIYNNAVYFGSDSGRIYKIEMNQELSIN